MPDENWDIALASAGFRVRYLDTELTSGDWASLANEDPPGPVQLFADLAARREMDLWGALVESAASVHPYIHDELLDGAALAPFRALLARTDHPAIIFNAASSWKELNRWGYLLTAGAPTPAGRSVLLVLRPPARAHDIRMVEHALALTLSPSYRRFIMLSNGLGVGARESPYVYGAGPQRANWNAVLLNLWMDCRGHNEIAARWREFQGTYAYERIMDRERGVDTFLSDETALVPFAHTYEDWCFDRARPAAHGEYPIGLWDHEAREATDQYKDFDDWFSGEVEPYLWPR